MAFKVGEKLRWKDDVARFCFLLEYLPFATSRQFAEDAVKLVDKFHTLVCCNTVRVIEVNEIGVEVSFEGQTIKLLEHEMDRWFQYLSVN